jgi:hypothetical protein
MSLQCSSVARWDGAEMSAFSCLVRFVPGSGQVRYRLRDARAAFAAITPHGQALARKARDSHHEFLRQTFAAALDDADLANLARIMDQISGSIPPAGTFSRSRPPGHQ